MRLDKFAGDSRRGVEFGSSRIRFISFTITSCRSEEIRPVADRLPRPLNAHLLHST